MAESGHAIGAKRRRRRSSQGSSVWANAALNALLVAFCVVLIWAPLPLGSNRDWSLALLIFSVGAILTVWGAVSIANTASMHPHQSKLWPAAALFCLGLAFACAQIIDLNQVDQAIGANWAKDYAHPIWGLASETLQTDLPAYISVNPHLSSVAIGKTLLYAGVFWIAFQLSQKASRAAAIVWTILLAGFLNAVIGILEVSAGFDLGGWLSNELPDSASRINGTLVNPNNFATFAAISLVAGMALLFTLLSEGIVLNRGSDIARRTTLATMSGPAFPLSAAVFGLAGVITLSGSRAGTVAMLVGALALALCLHRWTTSSGKSSSGAGSWGIVGIVTLGVMIAVTPLALRFSSVDDFSIRTDIAQDTLHAAMAAPLTGNGYGAFERYFPLYASKSYPGTVNAAHNDYLEMIADIGLVGGTALILAVVYLAIIALRGVVRRRRSKHFCAAAVAAATLCGFHAYFDFSLQIPAVGLALFALLGVGVAQSWQERSEANDPRTLA